MSLRRGLLGRTQALVGGTFVAVLIMPVLPDMFVELWGAQPELRDAWLRLSAIGSALLIILAWLVTDYCRQKKKARERAEMYDDLGRADVVILPLGNNDTYTRYAKRARVAARTCEFIIDQTKPRITFLISDALPATLATFEGSLKADGIEEVVVIAIDDVMNPEHLLIAESARMIEIIEPRIKAGDKVYVDITGGTAVMSLAMVQLAATLGAECVYVSEEKNAKTGTRIKGTNRPHRFHPSLLSGSSE